MRKPDGTTENSSETSDQALLYLQRRQVIGRLAGGIAHDSNNTLTAILAALDLARSDPALPPHLNDRLTKVADLARRGARCNARIQSFSNQTEAGTEALVLSELLDDAFLLLAPTLRSRGTQISRPSPPADLWPVQANREQVMQAFLNFCLLALDARPQCTQLELRLTNERVADTPIHPQRSGDFVSLSLHDIGPENATRPWAMVRDAPNAGTDPGRYATWGVEASRQIVAQHGGWIDAGADIHHGSYVKIFLPRAAARGARLLCGELSLTQPAWAEPSPDQHEAVLVVDDQQQLRWLVRAILAYRGYRVLEAGGVEEAVGVCQAAGGNVGVVLLNAALLAAGSAQFRERLRQAGPKAQVVLMIGDADPALKAVGTQTGTSVLRTPFTSETVLRAVRDAIEVGTAARPGRGGQPPAVGAAAGQPVCQPPH